MKRLKNADFDIRGINWNGKNLKNILQQTRNKLKQKGRD